MVCIRSYHFAGINGITATAATIAMMPNVILRLDFHHQAMPRTAKARNAPREYDPITETRDKTAAALRPQRIHKFSVVSAR